MRKQRAFTLIELMIVVAIFAVISAILIPNFIRARQHAEQRLDEVRKEAPVPAGGELPALERGRVDLQLTCRSRQIGLESLSGYEVTHQGLFTLAPVSRSGKTRLEFPFPRDASSIREASLEFLGGGRRYEPDDVVYTASRVVWVGQLPPDLEQVQLSYVATGQDVFVYDLPEASRLDTLDVAITGDLHSANVASWSLQPSDRKSDCLCWHFSNLVSRLPIALELVPEPSPLARVGTLFRLTGLAVLLFGLGLWYLAELYRPGALAQFRLGGFFLLALSYSTFFMIFAVLGFHQDVSVPTAFWVALACWAPPLVMHVAHVVDRQFALRLALPLGVCTLLLVVNGVYGGPWRDYVYVLAAVGSVTFLTTTYQRWLRIRSQRAELVADQLTRKRAAYRALLDEARSQQERVEMALARPDPRKLEPVRRRVSGLQETLLQNLTPAEISSETLESCSAVLAGRTAELRQSLERLEKLRQESPPLASGECCMACGQSGAAGKFCAGCGRRSARRVVCSGCQSSLVLPTHLWPEGKQPALHCPGCGSQLDPG